MKVWLTILLTLMLVSSGRAGSFRGFKKFKNRRNNHKDLRYITTPGVAKKYQTLDWYQPKKNSGRGAIVYIHGGGWHTGDKKNHMDDKVRYFRDDLGYSFVSVNYRLIERHCRKRKGRKMDPCAFPDNAYDVAAAISYVLKNARKYGATGKSVSLIGHSAGAHLAALVSTDEKYLKKYGVTLSNINFVAPLDTDAFDIPKREGDPKTIRNAFGRNRNVWKGASPINHVKRGKTPPHLLVYRGTKGRKKNVERYERKLRNMGRFVKKIYATQYSHEQINKAIGNKRDKFVTPQLLEMLKKYNWHHKSNACKCKNRWSTRNGDTFNGCGARFGVSYWCETKGKCEEEDKWKGMYWKWCR